MTKGQAKEVIEMMFKDKTDIPKEDVFKIIDMIDDATTWVQPITLPTYPSYPSNIPKPWWETWTFGGSSEPKVELNDLHGGN